MTWTLLLEQLLNGLQFGLMLFLIAAGLTLVFGIMDIMNLAHGSLYMAGAYVAAETMQRTGSFTAAVLVAAVATGVAGAGVGLELCKGRFAPGPLSPGVGRAPAIPPSPYPREIVWWPPPAMLTIPSSRSPAL